MVAAGSRTKSLERIKSPDGEMEGSYSIAGTPVLPFAPSLIAFNAREYDKF
jgi:hypothetical protein